MITRWANVERRQAARMLVLSVLTGLGSMLSALIFLWGLSFMESVIQGGWFGIIHPHPHGSATHPAHALPAFDFQSFAHGWPVILVPALAGLVVGWMVFRFAPQAAGHGIDSLIGAFHEGKGKIPTAVPLVKLLASLLTLSSGGSGGKEGPIALVGGGIGSGFARRFGLNPRLTRHLMLAGAAGGIGAVFRAPLGAAIGVLEILYKEDLETDALLPAVLASVTSYSGFILCRDWLGLSFEIVIFQVPQQSFHPIHLLTLLPLAFCCVTVGKLFMTSFDQISLFFSRLSIHPILKPALGGLIIGLIGWWMPQTLGVGMGYLQEALLFQFSGDTTWVTLRFVALFLILKMIAVSVTIGSGGSAGVFGPSLLLGGLTGFLFGLFCHSVLPGFFPNLPIPPLSTFVILGMASFFSAVAHAPLGALVMCTEMTQGYQLLAPLTLLCVFVILLSGSRSIYHQQVTNKFNSAAHLASISFDILREVPLKTIFKPSNVHTVSVMASLAELRKVMSIHSFSFPLPLVNEEGRPVGLLSMGSIRELIFAQEADDLFHAGDLMGAMVSCSTEEDLHSVLVKFSKHGYGRLPVFGPDEPHKPLGFITYQQVMEAYQKELEKRKE